MSTNTPNLSLLKKNAVVDASDTFNIDTILNNNWDKIDVAVGNKVDKVTGKQLSTEDYTISEKTKLSGIATGANNYTHPANHPPSIITQDASNRFVSDAKVAAWDAKETPVGAQAKADAVNATLNTHLADYTLQIPYAVATGTANTYAISTPIASLVAGMAVSVKINVASSGTSTLNWDGKGAKGLKKADGTNITNLKLNGVYTFRYDGTNFIVQGEGGEYGTADAPQVLAGYTFGKDTGIVNGTMPLNTGNKIVTGSGSTSQILAFVPNAYWNGTDRVVLQDANFLATNILSGKSIFGLQGTVKGLKSATGQFYSGFDASGGSHTKITGLSFYPKLVFAAPGISETVNPGYAQAMTCNNIDAMFSNFRYPFSGLVGSGSPSLSIRPPVGNDFEIWCNAAGYTGEAHYVGWLAIGWDD